MPDKSVAPVCGIYCGTCEYLREQCTGCGNEDGKPFWTTQMNVEVCPLYDCCINKKGLEHCGLCDELPCDMFSSLYDPSLSPEEGKQSILQRQNELIKRKHIGTDRWLREQEVT